jgi:outer membrane protein assembly factor BamB
VKKVLTSFALLILIVTACSPEAQATEGPIIDEQPTPTHIPVDLTPAQRAAITALSENLGLSAGEITVVSTEAVEWPDACLGIEGPELSCAQVITPGFRVILDANGKQVEYRTNEDGTQIGPATVAMSWKREGGIAGFCDYMTIYLSGEVQADSCKQGRYVEGRVIDVLSQQEMAKLDEWLTEYGKIDIDASDPQGVADRMVVTMTFMGTGSQQTISESTEQALLNLVQEVHQRLYK